MDTADNDPRLLVDLAVDGGLAATEREALRARLAGDESLCREEREMQRLHEALAAGRVVARPGFTAAVMAALPESAPWADRKLLGWRSVLGTLAAVLALALGAFGIAGARGADGVGFAAARAVVDFAASAALSGAGLLAASWRGVGMAVAAALDLPATVVFGIGVVAVNALLIALLRRPRRRRAALAAAVRRRR
ncbi:MAG TPA: hypothetical protein VN811_09220 [Thermoanaerobaculia bacterium]|nr:hypothetical protein [Thermoanaerobaculia bacterium]HXT51208.1 hypothetical protein [Thermoanaerobaculia bacterium]